MASGCLIGGTWREAASGETIPVLCPSDGEVFAEIARGGEADIDAAVRAARHAFDEGAWGRMPAFERGRLLQRWHHKVLDNLDELAALESRDTGKPLKQGRTDILCLARYLEFYAGAADKLHGDTLPFLEGYTVCTFREPHGVTGHIIPWNYPAQIFGRSIGASLAAGNACVLKPAEDACLTTLRMGELALEVGFPEGALNIVPGFGAEAGAALAEHRGIDFISFTGSREAGTAVQAAAAKNHVGCNLELGGKSPQIVFADADLDAALPVLVAAIIQNGGQTCSAGSRLLIERPVYDEVTARLAEKFKGLKVGPHARDLDCGPLINKKQLDRVRGYTEEARAQGVPLLAEATLADDLPAGGFYTAPALFGPVPPTARLACDEVFGPVLSAMPFEDEAEAARLANATDYGLVAAVWTRDGGRQQRMGRAIRAGQVFINGFGAGGGIELPFGGVKGSGHGREKGFEGLYEFTQLKTLVIKHD